MPTGPTSALPRIATPQDARARVREILGALLSALRETGRSAPAPTPALEFSEHRAGRDRPTGLQWRGDPTFLHVSALIASDGPAPGESSVRRLLEGAAHAAGDLGLRAAGARDVSEVHERLWQGGEGERAEVVVGARILLRAHSGPFLPGPEHTPISTTPAEVARGLRPSLLRPR
ncbi:hypothetical protein DEO23_05865 [Brachybacterium endophyticum]|uniref:Uncharacterized protein n=1 Tax=Brachybacterium endophyticum TaxID=2182385 RepID=A0A2U2RKU6_9MICO|nr:hypothetical protein DEO23_05865 [Brachybacterium endophyticum]